MEKTLKVYKFINAKPKNVEKLKNGDISPVNNSMIGSQS